MVGRLRQGCRDERTADEARTIRRAKDGGRMIDASEGRGRIEVGVRSQVEQYRASAERPLPATEGPFSRASTSTVRWGVLHPAPFNTWATVAYNRQISGRLLYVYSQSQRGHRPDLVRLPTVSFPAINQRIGGVAEKSWTPRCIL
jgi:hypothetical protein